MSLSNALDSSARFTNSAFFSEDNTIAELLGVAIVSYPKVLNLNLYKAKKKQYLKLKPN